MSGTVRVLPAPITVQQVIPATPGYFALTPVSNEAETAFDALRSPIVAWALERDTFQPYPISLDGIDVDTPSILRPDGKVDRLGGESFSSVDEWLVDLQKQFPRNRN